MLASSDDYDGGGGGGGHGGHDEVMMISSIEWEASALASQINDHDHDDQSIWNCSYVCS
jgi:hypothetical protein